jgi:hypothetical protein
MRSASFLAVLLLSAFFAALPGDHLVAQSRTNSSGTGGIHEIRGKVYLPSGRTMDTPVEVELQSISNFATLRVQTDRDGSYSFRNLAPGNYTVIVKGTDQFEEAREYSTLDTEAQGQFTRVPPIPKVQTVPIYLQFKRGVTLKNDVINAKWSSIPKSTLDHFKRGVELAQDPAKANEAAAEFKKAVEQSPQFAPAHTELGKLAAAGHDLDAAVVSFKNAIKYDDSDFDAHLNLGIAYMNLKQYDLAENQLVSAAYLNRTSVWPHYYLGMMYVVKDNLDVAQKAFETAKDLNGGRSLPNIHKYLGRIYLRKDMEKEGLEELETYIKLAPKAQDAEKVKKEILDIKAKHTKNAFV